jgi:hypothetical protein
MVCEKFIEDKHKRRTYGLKNRKYLPGFPTQYRVIRSLHRWKPFVHVSRIQHDFGLGVSIDKLLSQIGARSISHSLFSKVTISLPKEGSQEIKEGTSATPLKVDMRIKL